jgi:hypothetical protein
MAVAAVPNSGQVSGNAAGPMTLRELYQEAKRDALKPTIETRLKWLFWHAKAVGRVEVARAVLKRFEARDWEVHSRSLSLIPGTSTHQAMVDARPKADLQRAQDYLDEQVAFEQACRSVAEMLGAKGARP